MLWFWYILCHLKLIALIGKYQSVLSVHADYVALQEMVRSVIMHLSAASDPLETLSGSVCCFFCLCPVTHQWEHGLLVRAHKTLCFSFLRSINTESKWNTAGVLWSLLMSFSHQIKVVLDFVAHEMPTQKTSWGQFNGVQFKALNSEWTGLNV